MGIRSFLLIKVLKHDNKSMESYSIILRGGNPCSLTAWSYTVTSIFLKCTVLRSGRSCFLVAWCYTTTIHVS
jgi:hypothetical protein